MDAYMTTHFGCEIWNLCREENLYPTLSTSPREYFYIKQSRSDLKGWKPHFNGVLRLKSWDFTSMSGLTDMTEIWDLEPHVNWPQELNEKF